MENLKRFKSAADLVNLREYLTSGDENIDQLLKGGFRTGFLTEIYGESSSGKSQLCLQLAMNAQLPRSMGGLDASCVYICTENAFPIERLMEIVKSNAQKHEFSLDKLYISHIYDADMLESCILYQLPQLMEHCGVRLVIVDSIAGNFRYGKSNNSNDSLTGLLTETPSGATFSGDYSERARSLHSIASCLKRFARDFNAVVICVNQVTSSLNSNVLTRESLLSSSTLYTSNVVPALGLSWSQMINMRISMSRSSAFTEKESTIRKVTVDFAPHIPADSSAVLFEITPEGISSVLMDDPRRTIYHSSV